MLLFHWRQSRPAGFVRRMYVADSPVTVPAIGAGHAELVQKQVRAIEHTVTVSQPFYKIEMPQPGDARFISGIYP